MPQRKQHKCALGLQERIFYCAIESGDRHTGNRRQGDGRLSPPRAARTPRLHRNPGGLAEEEAVVTLANFLVDAESNLEASRVCCGSAAMIAHLIGASARNLILVLIGTVFAVAAGLYAIVHLPFDAIPDLSDTQVIVYTEYLRRFGRGPASPFSPRLHGDPTTKPARKGQFRAEIARSHSTA
jgi:hypothetical protein